MENKIVREVLEIAIFSGKIMLENGAETYRVEETINRICHSRGISGVESFVIPTGIFLSCNYDGEYYSYVQRTKLKSIDLEIITMVNDFSRKFVNTEMRLEYAKSELDRIKNAPHFSTFILSLFGGVTGGSFTLLFGGNFFEFIASFIVSVIVVGSVKTIGKFAKSFFIKNVTCGAINAVLSVIAVFLFELANISVSMDKIIIGSIMPLVPGVAMTNALRDSISGDLVSGVSKLSEAIIIAVAIAIGVGMVLQFRLLLLGGI